MIPAIRRNAAGPPRIQSDAHVLVAKAEANGIAARVFCVAVSPCRRVACFQDPSQGHKALFKASFMASLIAIHA